VNCSNMLEAGSWQPTPDRRRAIVDAIFLGIARDPGASGNKATRGDANALENDRPHAKETMISNRDVASQDRPGRQIAVPANVDVMREVRRSAYDGAIADPGKRFDRNTVKNHATVASDKVRPSHCARRNIRN
jgi:hypothetical protein